MSRKLFARMVVTVVIIAVLVSLLPIAALAAPPGPGAPPAPGHPVHHVVQPGENLTRIAMRYGTTVWAIAHANGIRNVNCIRAGQVLMIPDRGPGPGPCPAPCPQPGPRIYIVQPGDSLSGIAWRFGIGVCALAKANGIWNHNLIFAYQKLVIP